MHFHLPKPLHGWREFVGEVGIIVLGVLIALGAEQAVEAIHNGSEANDARNEINAEIVTDITRLKQRVLADQCVDARLSEIDRIVDAAEADGMIKRPPWIGRPPFYGIESERWDAASQSGRISRLPSSWQAQFGFLYTALRRFYYVIDLEQQVWSRLEALEGVDHLTPDGKLAIKSDIAQARYFNFQVRQISAVIFRLSAEHGLRPTSRHDPPFGVCWPMSTPTSQGQTKVAAQSTPQWMERIRASDTSAPNVGLQ
ncbi:MAG TPA: hypothetical protein VM912_04355 [Terriglobales bacterium]|nr:hypothetical protein [Terriglobales bacterium]